MATNWSDWWEEKKKNSHDFLRAAEKGEVDKLIKLMDNGIMQGKAADVNFKGLYDWNALHYAAEYGQPEIANVLLTQPGIEIEAVTTIKRTPLHLASIKGHTNIVRALIDKGADPNCRDFDEYSPLHFASEYGNIQTIIYLVKEAEAEPFLKNKVGFFPSDIAFNIDVRKVFESLLAGKQQPQPSPDGQFQKMNLNQEDDQITQS